MYIKNKDYGYLQGLYKSLDQVKRERFIDILIQAGAERIDKEVKDISKITILYDEKMFGQQEIDEKEVITRTMIKKAYKAIKEENKE